MANDITFDMIAPLIATQQARHTTLEVVFRCPVSELEVRSSATIEQGTGSRVKSAMQRSLWYSVRSALSQAVRQMVGGGTAGYMASSAAYSATQGAGQSAQVSFSQAEQEAAAVAAFKRVARQFAWDAGSHRFVSAHHLVELQTDLGRLLAATALTGAWDRAVLARMLAEVAAADGRVTDDERAFFDAFAGTSAEPIERLVALAPLNAGELGETTPAAREAMMAMAYAVAMSDESFDATEQVTLERLHEGLQIPYDRAQTLADQAREYVVDALLDAAYADGVADAQERHRVGEMAARLNVGPEVVSRLEVRLRKRKGLL
jgi:uncharacterized tellurite resistance protein B-like protein